MTSFIQAQLNAYTKIRTRSRKFSESGECAAQIIQNFTEYYQKLEERDIRKNRIRKGSGLISAQTYISKFKKLVITTFPDISPAFTNSLRLSKTQNKLIIHHKNKRVHENSIRLPEVNGDHMILDCRKCIISADTDPYKKLIALACLTGRRTSELLITIRIYQPQERHNKTSSKYWANVTGILKQRKNDPKRVINREIPFLAARVQIQKALRTVRLALGTGVYKGDVWVPRLTVAQANAKFAKQISRKMIQYCDVLCKIHDFRKFYALACFHYFNENHCSLPRLASDYLGHKSVSGTILTYLNFRVNGLGSIVYTD